MLFSLDHSSAVSPESSSSAKSWNIQFFFLSNNSSNLLEVARSIDGALPG